MGLIKEFKDFALRGNVVDMAIGVIIGGAFGGVVTSFVKDIMMPPINYATILFSNPGTNIPGITLREADRANGTDPIVIKLPDFGATIFNFLIVAFCLFLVVKVMNTLLKKKDAAPPPTPPDVVLLTEIRDLLKAKEAK